MKYADGYLEARLGLGDGVLDIGANGGMLTATYVQTVGPTGYVLAVEPDPETYSLLTHGIREMPTAHAIQAAVGATVGETVIYPDGSRTSRWEMLTGRKSRGVVVPMTTVDHLAPLVPKLRGVKVDVQGGEFDVLLGASETLRRAEVTWQVEVWPKGLEAAGASVGALCDLLASVGLWPLTRTWDTVREQCARLKPDSYLDVVCRHVA